MGVTGVMYSHAQMKDVWPFPVSTLKRATSDKLGSHEPTLPDNYYYQSGTAARDYLEGLNSYRIHYQRYMVHSYVVPDLLK
ncbi:hypothetical protein FKM82_001459 [Ascaphus truei]